MKNKKDEKPKSAPEEVELVVTEEEYEAGLKRGWTDVSIPSPILPGPRPIWLVIVALAVLAALAFLRENDGAAAPAR